MSVVIIGGGITGLSAAWAWAKTGAEITLVEPSHWGGLLRTETVDGCVVECGADSWIRTKPWLRNLACELNLEADIISCNSPLERTGILRRGRLVPIPEGLRMVTPTKLRPVLGSTLFGWRTKARILMETARRPFEGGDRSIADLVRDHFGQETVEYLAEPLFAGVYGGSPEELGAAAILPRLLEQERSTGSLIRAARREAAVTGPMFESMRRGLGQIPAALVERLNGRVTFVRGAAERVEGTRVRVAGEWTAAERVLLACGAPQAAMLLAGEEVGGLLASIPHTSATIYAFGFRLADLQRPPRAFGFLVPRAERRTIMAATWVTNKFTDRAPADRVLVRCFVGGDCGVSLLPDVLADLKRIAGIAAEPLFHRVYQWPRSMPQYGVGHMKLVERIRASLPRGISAIGSFAGGVGMPDCARAGLETTRTTSIDDARDGGQRVV